MQESRMMGQESKLGKEGNEDSGSWVDVKAIMMMG